jgi:long-chain fatty acid transport protein
VAPGALRRDKIAVMPAMSLRILPWDDASEGPTLAIGGGATILADLSGDFVFDLSASAARSVATRVKLPYDAAPNLGIFFYPASFLSLGVAYRGELALKADFDVQIVVDGTNLFPLQLEAVTLFQPQQVALGIAVDPLDWLTLAVDLTWANWSAYDDAFITIRPVVPQAEIDFKDIWIPRLGVEVEPVKGWALRGGYYYQPTPVPDQKGATNLVDLDKHVLSLGLAWTWWTETERIVRTEEGPKIETADRAPLTIEAFFQWHHLVGESVDKVPGSSPQTGDSYEASGEIWNFGIQLSIRS